MTPLTTNSDTLTASGTAWDITVMFPEQELCSKRIGNFKFKKNQLSSSVNS